MSSTLFIFVAIISAGKSLSIPDQRDSPRATPSLKTPAPADDGPHRTARATSVTGWLLGMARAGQAVVEILFRDRVITERRIYLIRQRTALITV